MSGALERHRRARKSHQCDGGCGQDIEPGATYHEVVLAPWTTVVEDVDDEGRGISSRTDAWHTQRYHSDCYGRVFYGAL